MIGKNTEKYFYGGKMKRAISLFLVISAIVCLFGVYAGATSIGCGVRVMAENTVAIKTGRIREKLQISAEDFKRALAVTDFESITVTELPKSSEGVLLLAGRRVKAGQRIKKRALSNFIFVPCSKEVTESSFKFVMNGVGASEETIFRIRFIDGVNAAPVIYESESMAVSLNTQSGITYYGKLLGSDPDGDDIEFITVSYPKRGSIVITDSGEGKYEYTPSVGFVGTDSFSYVVRDEYGNFSEVKEVRVVVSERLLDVVFADMMGRSEYGAAVAMCAMGVMAISERGGLYYFFPEERVTRAEFVMMLLKAYGIDPKDTETFFDDDGDIPAPMRGYVSVAAGSGYVDGDFGKNGLVFRPNDSITKTEAAVIIARMLNVSASEEELVFAPIEGLSTGVAKRVYAVITLGIFEALDGEFSGDVSLSRAEAAECLYRLLKVK